MPFSAESHPLHRLRRHIHERERVVEIDVADLLARHARLVGDRPYQIGGAHPVALAHPQEEPGRLLRRKATLAPDRVG